jgi:endonuclease YncB( thermonuclease family)
MREYHSKLLSRQPVAVALVGVLTLLALVPPMAGAAAGPAISGSAAVIDGDTIDIGGERIRLEGIDAPETGQSCGRKWVGHWDCGQGATRLLIELTKDRDVTCVARGRDKYGRTLGVCSAGGLDLNAEMVRRGMAWAFLKYSRTYVEVEAEARALRVGIWEGDAVPAWNYRAQRWASAEHAAPGGCAIKGNVSRHGNIYHVPWSPWYGKVKVDTGRGERWFCSEEEAAAAGWRPAGSAQQ